GYEIQTTVAVTCVTRFSGSVWSSLADGRQKACRREAARYFSEPLLRYYAGDGALGLERTTATAGRGCGITAARQPSRRLPIVSDITAEPLPRITSSSGIRWLQPNYFDCAPGRLPN